MMKRLSIWDILTIVTLVATLVVAIVVLSIFSNPDSSLNPYPWPTTIPTIFIPSPTATLRSLPPTWTPEPLVAPTTRPTSTPIPTWTPVPALP
jgi:hypothetical protein